MFDRLTDGLSRIVQGFSGKGLTEANVRDTCAKVRRALIDADVALDAVDKLVGNIESRALADGMDRVPNASEVMLGIIREELTLALGQQSEGLKVSQTPAVVLMVGLQGTGKTTSVAKLARFQIERESHLVSVVSTDVYRPAAVEQLRVLAEGAGARFIPSEQGWAPIDIARDALQSAKANKDDLLIVDTAGRLAIDESMMSELSQIHSALNPAETLFVVDAMAGQDAALVAQKFNELLPLTGVVVSKIDGDARGGAALSVKYVTGKPIKFLGVGERTDALEMFHPDRIASRLLGMGDFESLIEDASRKVDSTRAARVVSKVIKRRRLDLEDLKVQLEELDKMGGMDEILKNLPTMSEMRIKKVRNQPFGKMIVIINSMTGRERKFPDLLNPSRKKRIASGSGTTVQDVNALLRHFSHLQKQTRKMGRTGKKSQAMRQYAQAIDAQMGGTEVPLVPKT